MHSKDKIKTKSITSFLGFGYDMPLLRFQANRETGRTHYGKQRFLYQVCNRQFVLNLRHQPVSQFTKDLIDKLLQDANFSGWDI